MASSTWTLAGMALAEWPQWRGPCRDGVWNESGIRQKFSEEQIPVRWRVPIGSGYSGPTVAGGRVFLMDRQTEPEQIERVLCFNWENGQSLWTHPYECTYENVSYTAGPRASVSIDQNRVYALGTMGHLHCLEADRGHLVWKRDLNADYKIRMPVWGIAASPLVDGNLVIVHIGGSDGACLVALDKRTGDERWRKLDDRASYSAPIIIDQAGQRVLVCWTGDHVAGMDPSTGKIYWMHPFKPVQMVINIATPVVQNDRLFVSSFYDGSLMLRLHTDALKVEEIWRRIGRDERNTDSLHSIISTPYLQGDHIYGVDSYGELRCLNADTGDRVWEDLTAVDKARWATIHMVRNGTNIWMFNEHGELIISRLTPEGFHELSRAKLIEPTQDQLRQRGGVCWAHPAFAYKHIFARNDVALVCADLAGE